MPNALDKSTKLALAALLTLLVGVCGFGWYEYATTSRNFERDDSPRLGDGETGLKRAYGNLRRKGFRVAVQPAERSHPRVEGAWWIFQPGAEWFAEPEVRAQEVKAYLNKGGTVVLAPDESMTVVEADPGLNEEETPPARLDRFFGALALDLHLMAFESEQGDDGTFDEGEGEEPTAEAPPPDGGETSGYTLPVAGRGAVFDELGEVRTSWGTYWEGDSLLRGEIRLNSDGFPLVIELPFGSGRLVLVAESTYFENEFLEYADNGKLLEALARHYGGSGIQLVPGRDSLSRSE